MRAHHKLTSQERDKIAYGYAVGESLREMARRLGRSPSSIFEEIKRNTVNGRYHSIRAHQASEARRQNSHKKYRLKTRSTLQSYVVEKLELGWSPEQIAGKTRKEIREGVRPAKEYINHESIYQYIYDESRNDLRLWEKLPRRHRKRRRWLGRKSRPVKIPNRVSIRERPEGVNSRRDFGHWEGDTVVGDQHKAGVHTEVERVSRLLLAQPVSHIRTNETCLAQLCLLGSLPKQARQSTTLDNGSENARHTRLQEELGLRTYFAHPYCSWQRGTNEYTNGLLRRSFPKRTDVRNVTQEQLHDVVHRLNNTPRKVLQYHTPREVFSERLSEIFRAA